VPPRRPRGPPWQARARRRRRLRVPRRKVTSDMRRGIVLTELCWVTCGLQRLNLGVRVGVELN
jgi:hypothetical protein